jgi:Spy/CpxP family protein refolding chaperone
MIKRIIYVIFIITVITVAAYSMSRNQENSNYWGHGFGMGYAMGCYDDYNLMMNNLGITRDQANKIADIDNKYRKLFYENRGNFDKIEALRKEHKKEIESLLDASQKNKFDSVYNSRWGGWGPKHVQRHMGRYYGQEYGMGYGCGIYSSAGYLKSDLGLTDAQVKKITEIDKKFSDLYYNSRGDYQKIETLRYEHKEEIEKELTPEQKKKFMEAYDYRWRGWGQGRGMMGQGMMGF